MDSGRHRFYGVRRGRVPGIYTKWEDCKQQVNGFRDCEFKGFRNADEAEAWLGAGGVLLEPPPPIPPPSPLPPPSPPRLGLLGSSAIVGGSSLSTQLHAMQVGARHPTQLESGCVRSQTDSTVKGKAVARDRLGSDFLITEDMEVYLIRVCSQLRLEYPVFTRRESYSQNGLQLYGFWVVLQSAQHGVNWVVDGLFSADEGEARQDAAYQMLEKVLTMTGREIMDYNYRKVAALKERIRELEKQVSTPTYQRIRELQAENDTIRHELEMFRTIFDE